MATPIEEQMHRCLTEREEERCRRLEAERASQSVTGKRKKVTRKKIRKPWKRPSKKALCQEVNLLMLVEEYDYDLSDADFRSYAEARGVLRVAGEPGSRRWEFYSNFIKTKEEFLRDPYFRLADMLYGAQYVYTPDEMEIAWRIVLLGRAALQDCWELYSEAREFGQTATR